MADLNVLREILAKRLGTSGKWDLLFADHDTLIPGRAERLEEARSIAHPLRERLSRLGKPDVVYVPDNQEWPSIPVLHDPRITASFAEAGLLHLMPHFFMAGEPAIYRLDPSTDRFGFLVAGGNAAGLNMVVDSVVKRLTALASAMKNDRRFRPDLIGYMGGYPGLKSGQYFHGLHGRQVTIDDTDPRAGDPCIFLKTLRGSSFADTESPEAQQELSDLADSVIKDRLSALFIIGGNGSLLWANRLYRKLKERDYPIAIVCGPKTMDLDIAFAEATFGFRTAVDHAVEFIRTIHWEAESQNRIAVIELFGAASGFVALHAGFLSGVADFILVPEILPSRQSVFQHIEERLRVRRHAVVVVAEGALLPFLHGQSEKKEQAFQVFVDQVKAHFDVDGRVERYKLLDVRPRYLIRGTHPNSFDLDLAKYTGYLMADTALAGYTNCSVQLWQGDYVLVPLEAAVGRRGQIQNWSPYFWYMAQRYVLSPEERQETTPAE